MKVGPIEKIYEAYSALADQRICFLPDNKAKVTSSDAGKTYTVSWEGNTYASDDNATYWQGYCGYPVLAVLMKQGRLPFDPTVAERFADINWHQLNRRFKRDYAAALEEVARERGIDLEKLQRETENVYAAAKKLDIILKRGRR